jgi:hypothetical protein
MRLKYRAMAVGVSALAATTLTAHANWFRDETPPVNAKPLSAILQTVEDRGYKTITEVEFEDGRWEIEVHQAGGKEIEIHVDALSGQISEKWPMAHNTGGESQ